MLKEADIMYSTLLVLWCTLRSILGQFLLCIMYWCRRAGIEMKHHFLQELMDQERMMSSQWFLCFHHPTLSAKALCFWFVCGGWTSTTFVRLFVRLDRYCYRDISWTARTVLIKLTGNIKWSLVQRVEHWTCDQQVMGSNPTQGKAVSQRWASCSHLVCASVTKQYSLVPAKELWYSAAGKVTAGLAESNGSLPPGGWLIDSQLKSSCCRKCSSGWHVIC